MGRRAGKTQCATMILIDRALQRKGIYWWVAPDHIQSRVAMDFMENALWELNCFSKGDKIFYLPNGSRIEMRTSESPKGLRGQGLCGLVYDEAAHQSEKVWKEALMPALADKQGWVIMPSTPNGFGWWYDWYLKIKDNKDWYVQECPSTVSPLMTQKYLDEQRLLMGENRYQQEYGGRFVQHGDSLFLPQWFDNILVEDIPANAYQRGIIAVDLSLGYQHSDYQVVLFLGYLNGMFYCDAIVDRMPVPQLIDHMIYFYEKYKPQDGMVIETNCFQALVAHSLVDKFKLKGIVPPIYEQVNSVRKETRIGRLATLLSRGELKIKNNTAGQNGVNQLRDWPSKESHDDFPDCLESAWRGLIET